MKTKVFKLMAAFMVALVCVFFSACKGSEDIELSKVGNDIVTTHDFDGYSIGTITSSADHYRLGIRLDLGFLKLEVPENILGQLDEVIPTMNPKTVAYIEDGMTGEQTSRAYAFSPDGQTAAEVDQWVADSTATSHYEITDVFYTGEYDATQVDTDGKVWRIIPYFNASCVLPNRRRR